MRNFIVLVITLFLVAGCTSKAPSSGALAQSRAIFIDESFSKVYINFSDLSGSFKDSNLGRNLSLELSKKGYEIVGDESRADLVIKGQVVFFKELATNSPNSPRVGISVGRGWSGFGIGVGTSADLYKDYIFEGSMTLSVSKKGESNTVLLTYQSNPDIGSKDRALAEFESLIEKRILSFFE